MGGLGTRSRFSSDERGLGCLVSCAAGHSGRVVYHLDHRVIWNLVRRVARKRVGALVLLGVLKGALCTTLLTVCLK